MLSPAESVSDLPTALEDIEPTVAMTITDSKSIHSFSFEKYPYSAINSGI